MGRSAAEDPSVEGGTSDRALTSEPSAWMLTMTQAVEAWASPPQSQPGNGLREVLSRVVEEVRRAIDRDVPGAELLHSLLSSAWLPALLRVYECLLQFQTLPPSPVLTHASSLSREVLACLRVVSSPSAETQELYSLLTRPHLQALLSAHDAVVQWDMEPALAPLPEDLPLLPEDLPLLPEDLPPLPEDLPPLPEDLPPLPEDLPPLPEDLPEDTMRNMDHHCLFKSQLLLNGGGTPHSQWNSLRRLTLERLVLERGAWSGEELADCGGRGRCASTGLLPPLAPEQTRPLPLYQSTGSCRLHGQTSQLWEQGLNQSAPSVYNPSHHGGASAELDQNSADQYAYPPSPLPAYSLTAPNSPSCCPRAGGRVRARPAPGPAALAQTAPSSPMAPRRGRHRSLTCSPRPTVKVANHQRLSTHLTNHRCSSLDLTNRRYPSLDLSNHTQPSVELVRQASLGELQRVRFLRRRMAAATERMSDGVEENARVLSLLAEVVDKLQGLVLASKTPETPRPKPSTPRSACLHRRCSCSSSSSFSSSSSSSLSPSGEAQQRVAGLPGGRGRAALSVPQRSGANGHSPLTNGNASRPQEDYRDQKTTGCLSSRKKRKTT